MTRPCHPPSCSHTCKATAAKWLYPSAKLDFAPRRPFSAFSFCNDGRISHHASVQEFWYSWATRKMPWSRIFRNRHTLCAVFENPGTLPLLQQTSLRLPTTITIGPPQAQYHAARAAMRVRVAMYLSSSVREECGCLKLKPSQARCDLSQCPHAKYIAQRGEVCLRKAPGIIEECVGNIVLSS